MDFTHHHSNRYRSYSKDSDAYPSESSSSLSGYHTGNHSHANHDDSSLSSADNNHDKKTKKSNESSNGGDSLGGGRGEGGCSLTTTMLSGTTSTSGTKSQKKSSRRRSHRPRGCRGGRKNRKKQQMNANDHDAHLSVPKEIVGGVSFNNIMVAPLPLSPKDNLQMAAGCLGSAIPRSGLLPQKAFWGNKSSSATTASSTTTTTTGKGYRDENFGRPYSNNTVTLPWIGGAMDMLQYTSPLTHAHTQNLATAYSADHRHHHHHHHHHQQQQQVGSDKPYLFRPVQEGISSFLFNSVRGAMDIFEDGRNCPSSNSSNKNNKIDILPPPPKVEKNSPTFEGPNPYALCTSITDDSFDHTVQPSYSDTAHSIESSESATTTSSTTATSSSSSQEDYRTMRIEKQQQMIAEDGGSSLFATSPRTFLMGGRGEPQVLLESPHCNNTNVQPKRSAVP